MVLREVILSMFTSAGASFMTLLTCTWEALYLHRRTNRTEGRSGERPIEREEEGLNGPDTETRGRGEQVCAWSDGTDSADTRAASSEGRTTTLTDEQWRDRPRGTVSETAADQRPAEVVATAEPKKPRVLQRDLTAAAE